MKKKKCLACNINSLSEFIEISQAFPKNWIFRGQENSLWTLQTSLEREVNSIIKNTEEFIPHKIKVIIGKRLKNKKDYYTIDNSDEYHAIRDFKRKTKNIMASNIDALCSMQHFGAKTRLLDFSFSIGIALFFAIEKNTIGDNNRCIWCINTEPITRQIISQNSSVFNDCLQKYAIDASNEDILYYFLKYQEGEDYQECLKKQADLCITENDEILHNPSVIPINLQGNNDRINVQNGLFLFPQNLKMTFCENLCSSLYSGKMGEEISKEDISNLGLAKVNSVKYIIQRIKGSDTPYIIQLRIPNSQREQFMDLCYWFNISTHTIYPDMEGAARSVSYGIPKFKLS